MLTAAGARMRGQASMELLVTVAFAVAVLLAVIALAYSQTMATSQQLSMDQAQQDVTMLKRAVETVGAQGAPAKATVNIVVPDRVKSITIGSRASPFIGREIIFTVSAGGSDSESVAAVLYDVTGNLSNYTRPGTYPISVEAVDDCNGTGEPCVVVLPA